MLRKGLYKRALGYNISHDSYIGFLSYINVGKKCVIEKSKIGFLNRISCEYLCVYNGEIRKMNVIRNLHSFTMKEKAIIVSSNYFVSFSRMNERSSFTIGKNTLITSNHYFDLENSISIGNNVVVGGSQTQMWTHGFDIYRNMISGSIKIGNNIYIGSRCLFCLGIEICDEVSIASGTTVSKSIKESGFYISQSLVRKSDTQSFHTDNKLFNHGRFFSKEKGL